MSIRAELTKTRTLSDSQEGFAVFLFVSLYAALVFVAQVALLTTPAPLASDLWIGCKHTPSLELWMLTEAAHRASQAWNLRVIVEVPAVFLGLTFLGFAAINAGIFRKVGR